MPTPQPSPFFPKAQVLSLIQGASVVPVVWRTDKRPHQGQQPTSVSEHAWIVLYIQSYRAVGVDERRYFYNQSLNAQETFVVGQRQFTLQCVARSLDASLEAFDLLERVRFKLRAEASLAVRAQNLSIRDIDDIVTLPDDVAEGRVVSSATMDVRMNLAIGADPLEVGENDYITQVDSATNGVIPGTTLP